MITHFSFSALLLYNLHTSLTCRQKDTSRPLGFVFLGHLIDSMNFEQHSSQKKQLGQLMKHSYPHPRGRQKIAPTQYFIRSAPLVIKIVPRPTITPLENICTTKTRAHINCVFYCVQLEMLID